MGCARHIHPGATHRLRPPELCALTPPVSSYPPRQHPLPPTPPTAPLSAATHTPRARPIGLPIRSPRPGARRPLVPLPPPAHLP